MNDIDEPSPAPLQIADIDDETLAALFTDLGALGEDLTVLVKQGPSHVDPSTTLSLDRARELLTRGLVVGVQLRYRFRGADWWDTLMPTSAGYRLVRMQQREGREEAAG